MFVCRYRTAEERDRMVRTFFVLFSLFLLKVFLFAGGFGAKVHRRQSPKSARKELFFVLF
jgi:hypothetical protein